MSTKYYLQKVPVEAVQPGFSLAIPHDGDYRLFQVDCTQMCQRSGQPVMIRLMSESSMVASRGSWNMKRARR